MRTAFGILLAAVLLLSTWSVGRAIQTTWIGKSSFAGECVGAEGRAGYLNFFRRHPGDPSQELEPRCYINWTETRDSDLRTGDTYNDTWKVGTVAGVAANTWMVTENFVNDMEVHVYVDKNCQGHFRTLRKGTPLRYVAIGYTGGLMSFRGPEGASAYPACW